MGRLDGKVAVISGAARGQGEAEARLFAEEGACVVLGDILDERGAAVASDIGTRARYLHLDVRDERDWAAAIELAEDAFGSVSVLVNNAGIFGGDPPHVDTTLEQYREVIDVNQVGTFLGMRTVVPSMVNAGGGSIINISSVNGLVGFPNMVAYTSSKWAIRGMTKGAAIEFGPLGIRVNCIVPGGVDTEMLTEAAAESGATPTDAEPVDPFAQLPLQRISQPIEIARLALFLASDEASYSTGSDFLADGGMTAGPLGWALS